MIGPVEESLFERRETGALGRITGAVAHDLNNLLTAIHAACEIAAELIPPAAPAAGELTVIRQAVLSAERLTRQLLAIAGGDRPERRPVRLDRLVAQVKGLVQRVVGRKIEVAIEADPDLAPVFADPGQLEQVVFNLAANARDAMPEGGRLTFESRGASRIRPAAGFGLGDFVLLRVTDTGTGMTPHVQEQIFEPFFTTKSPGQGTGLGLATCRRIVAGAGGVIQVRSAPGLGSMFEIYLPRYAGPVESPAI